MGWDEMLLSVTEQGGAKDSSGIFQLISNIALVIGFQNCAYERMCRLPISSQRHQLVSNFPPGILDGYENYRTFARKHSSEVASSNAAMDHWELTHSTTDGAVVFSCTTINFKDALGARAAFTVMHEKTSPTMCPTLRNSLNILALACVANLALSEAMNRETREIYPSLSTREVEVLRWTADGKSAADVSEIMGISKATVAFHIKNAATKLTCNNKPGVAVKAALLGLI